MGLFGLFRVPAPETDKEVRHSHPFVYNRLSRLSERWPRTYYDTDAFFLRLNRALFDIPEYSYKMIGGNSMQIYSENQHRMYFCDLTHCDCDDFGKKLLPCKHMIFLDISMNGLSSFYEDAFGFTANDVSSVVNVRQPIWNVIRCYGSDCSGKIFDIPRTTTIDHLIRDGYLTEHFCDLELLKKFSRPELAALIRISGASVSGSKDKMIQWITENSPAIIQYCRMKYVFWSFPETYLPLFHFLHRYTYTNNCMPKGD